MNPPFKIELKNVYKSFGSKHVLQGLNLGIKEQETFVILGPSGCGKSVTLKIITGLLQADAGSVFVNGQDITKYTESDFNRLRENFGMLFQNAALFDSLNVCENVAFVLKQKKMMSESKIRERVLECLDMVGLAGVEHKMPSELSGGMRKRVGLARAIAYNPSVIFYDEPTTGLDPIRSTEIDLLVNKLKKELGVTSVVITHDLKSAFRIADRVGLHYEGKIWEVSPVQDFSTNKSPLVQQFLQGSLEGPIS